MTHFARADRADEKLLRQQIELVSSNPMIDGLLHMANGLLAVLNEQRQVLALNDTMLRWLGIDDPAPVLGLRPGEIVRCVHAHDSPGGCGTGQFCASCGAAIAVVTSLAEDAPAHRTCAITIEKDGKPVELFLRVQASPVRFGGQRIVLVFLDDITAEQDAATLHRVFLHDIVNLVSSLVTASEALAMDVQRRQRAVDVRRLCRRLAAEVKLQRCLTNPETSEYQYDFEAVSVGQVIDELRQMVAWQAAARDRRVSLPEAVEDASFRTDLDLLLRVLGNMLTNALEATEAGGEVRVFVEGEARSVAFCVWNRQAIAPDIAQRIFQRNFSTKAAMGRGLGTYSMKLLGERFLGGKVSFTTSAEAGTVFRIELAV